MNNQTIQIEKILKTLKNNPESRPTAAFRTNARIRILNTITNSQIPLQSQVRRPIWMTYALRLGVFALFLTGGTVYAAQSSLPKDVLFPVKVLSERVALTLSPTQKTKTTVANTIIGRRAMEIEQAKNDGNKKEIQQTVTNYESTVSEIRNNKYVSHDDIEREVSKHESLLQESDDNESKQTLQNKASENKEIRSQTTSTPTSGDTIKQIESSSSIPLSLPSSKESLEIKIPEVNTTETFKIDN